MTDTAARSADLERFRAEARAWIEENAPAGIRHPKGALDVSCWGGRKWTFVSDDQRLWLERTVAKGWTVPTWPVEYGGAGLSPAEGRIVDQEMARIGARRPLDNHGIWMLAPAMLKYGTDEQKRRFLPPIARGEIRWAQGYSEPNAGSDLANVQTRGVADGDAFVVDGTKLWSSFACDSDCVFALVRTEPEASKHAGISFLLIDMDSPGVTVTPYRLISGEDHFAQIFFDQVRVPMADVLGARGQGWEVTRYLLQHERAMIGERTHNPLGAETLSDRARRVAGEAIDPALVERVLDVELDSWALRIWIERMGDQARAGSASPVSSSAIKVFGTELGKRRSEALLAIDGADALVAGTPAAQAWLSWPMGTIGGGTNEIQLNIIAKRGLGLPGA